jgi:FkbM family methyltransferase
MSVAEVGGHIGYITNYYSQLVGTDGKVTVFEPGTNNLKYIRKNLEGLSNVELVEKGAGAAPGELDFFEDQLTGQNNSFVEDFDVYKLNSQLANKVEEPVRRRVQLTTLDLHFEGDAPDFIKIDVEGFELEVLMGAKRVLRKQPIVMVEVQRNEPQVYELLKSLDYLLFDETGNELDAQEKLRGNIFCLSSKKHQLELESLSWHPPIVKTSSTESRT